LPEGGELMAEEFFIPKLGQTVEEVTLVKWQVEDGAKVDQGQPLIDVETDKAVFPVEANASGYLHIGPYKEGDTLPVLTVVALIGKPEDKFEVKTSEPSIQQSSPLPVFASPRARKLAAQENVDLTKVMPTGYGGIRIAERDVAAYLNQAQRITPIALRMAQDIGVDLHKVSGSGPGGRIVKEDVARIANLVAPTAPTSPIVPPPNVLHSTTTLPQPIMEITERIPLKGVRGIIADRLGTSVHTTARVTLLMEVDATELVAARERLKSAVTEEWGFSPGYNDLLVKIVAGALRKFPYMNARLAPEAIELLGHINIGLAVDTERGLLVPVLRDADQKSLRQIGIESRQLVENSRIGRLLPDDLSGGTFTITNLGMFDVDAFTPVINLPEAAILGVGRIAPKVVPRNNEAVIRQMMTLSLVFDHRLVDGAPAARFLQHIKQVIEEPYLLLAV
jgi:pyruvate dehydrogenase E2 component (dihydrolipoamide acetyltransferase)